MDQHNVHIDIALLRTDVSLFRVTVRTFMEVSAYILIKIQPARTGKYGITQCTYNNT